ncbi:AFG2-interacting ribosome maturation factor-like [Oscarella lobularis]|uniref:AFG2-interacting ribosome maturation factor-like n=1 Tax=Oscarella lobularis TaxID=121494 RepID=UPI003313A27D
MEHGDCFSLLLPSLRTAQDQVELWKVTEVESEGLIELLCAACDRLRAVLNANDQTWGALAGFPDLPRLVANKQRKSIETLMKGLRHSMETFQCVRDEILQQYKRSLSIVFDDLSGQLSKDEIMTSTPFRPSIHCVLQLLSELNEHLSSEAERKRLLLSAFVYEDSSSTLREEWNSTRLQEKIKAAVQLMRFSTSLETR